MLLAARRNRETICETQATAVPSAGGGENYIVFMQQDCALRPSTSTFGDPSQGKHDLEVTELNCSFLDSGESSGDANKMIQQILILINGKTSTLF